MATLRTIEVELSTTGLGADGKPQRLPLLAGDPAGPSTSDAGAPEAELEGEHMLINMGP